MKKSVKIVLLVIAALTVVTVIAAFAMLNAVRGDALFYMNSTLGNIYAVCYRWVCLASAILVAFWIVYGYTKRASIKEFSAKLKPKQKEKPAAKASEPASAKRFCANCGKQITGDNKFCSSCGTPAEITSEAPKEETH